MRSVPGASSRRAWSWNQPSHRRAGRVPAPLGGLAAALLAFALWAPAAAFAAAPEEPQTEPANQITATTAVLFGTLSPHAPGQPESTWHFLYKPSSTATKAECESPGALKAPEEAGISGGGEAEFVGIGVGGLTPGTEYVVCLAATSSSSETTVGTAVSFKTALPPEAPQVKPPSEVKGTSAVFHGALNPAAPGDPGSYEFFYRADPTECQGELTSPNTPAAGAEGEEVQAEVTLIGSTTYTYCLLARNGAGEFAFSAPETFATEASAPLVLSQSAANLTPFTATLQAEVNPENQETTSCAFQYGTASVSENEVPCEQGPLSGSSPQLFSSNLSGLEAGTAYHFRVLLTNATGEGEAPEAEFTTLALQSPIFGSASASAITSTDATLEAHLNPDSQETTYEFQYATNEAMSENLITLGEGTLPAEYAELPAGPVDLGDALKPGTIYFYRVIATNGTGTTEGPVQSFETSAPTPPLLISQSVSAIAETTASFEAKVNPEGRESTYGFEFATDEAFTANLGTIEGPAPLPAKSEEIATGPLKATGLQGATHYYYRAFASNPIMGTSKGPIGQFTTIAKPALTTGAASEATRTAAKVAGTANPNGAPTTYRFVYVTQAGYRPGATECPEAVACAYAQGQSTAPRSLFATGYSPEAAGPVQLEELAPGTTYHYAIMATNQAGTTVGGDQTFTTTQATPPTAITGAASGIGPNSATISGTIDSAGLATTMRFEFATAPTAPGQGSTQAAQVVSENGNTEMIQASFDQSLAPNTTYYYRAVATNPDGSAYGAQRSFTTAAAAAISPPSAEVAPSLAPKKCPKGRVRKGGRCVKKKTPKKHTGKQRTASHKRGGSK